MPCEDYCVRQGVGCTKIILAVRFHMKQENENKDKYKELIKRMRTFNELLGDYLDAIDMDNADEKEEDK